MADQLWLMKCIREEEEVDFSVDFSHFLALVLNLLTFNVSIVCH